MDSEKTLKKVAESTLQEKTWEVAQAKKKLAAAKRAQDSANHKVEILKGKLEESDTKLAQAQSVVTARIEELRAMKKRLEKAE